MLARTLLSIVAVSACFLGSGCAWHPFGEDWNKLDPVQQDARVAEVLGRIVAGGVDGEGGEFADRRVLSCDLRRVVYQPASEDPKAKRSRLAWADVEAVENQPLDTLPSRPETLYLYLARDSRSGKMVTDLVVPPLAGVGIVRSYVMLRSRERWARNRMVRALQYIKRRRRASPRAEVAKDRQPLAKATAPQPRTEEELKAIEKKLLRLKEWREKKLISEEEYLEKRKQLLGKL